MISCRFLVDVMMRQDGTDGATFFTESLKLAGPGLYARSCNNCSC
jgi:hypothetical protein